MIVTEVDPAPDMLGQLPGASFCDCWSMDLERPAPLAVDAVTGIFGGMPLWVRFLLRLRDRLVGLGGLKPAASQGAEGRFGPFPIVSQTDDRVVMGFDDWHLDFRIVVDVSTRRETGASVGLERPVVLVSTLVRPHNAVGRLYLACVMPFHRMIVPATIRQLAQ